MVSWTVSPFPHCVRGFRKKSMLQMQGDGVNTGSVETKLHEGHIGRDSR